MDRPIATNKLDRGYNLKEETIQKGILILRSTFKLVRKFTNRDPMVISKTIEFSIVLLSYKAITNIKIQKTSIFRQEAITCLNNRTIMDIAKDS